MKAFLSAYILPQILGNLSQTNSSICPDPRLLVVCSSCQKLQQFPIDRSVTELVYDRQHTLDGLFSNNRRDISETGSLSNNQLCYHETFSRSIPTIGGKILSFTIF